MSRLDNLKPYAPVVVRIGMSLVFLWFGFNQVSNVEAWVGIVPSWASGIFGSANTLVMLNGWFEIIFGIVLIIGFQTRIVSLILALHLISIATNFGLKANGIRDFGLMLATFSIFLNGPDMWSLDTKLKRKRDAQGGAV